jgi:hypothetical protein
MKICRRRTGQEPQTGPVTTSTIPSRRNPPRRTGPSRRVPLSKANLSRATIPRRRGQALQAAGRPTTHTAARLVEARRIPAEALPAVEAVVVAHTRAVAEAEVGVRTLAAAGAVVEAVAAANTKADLRRPEPTRQNPYKLAQRPAVARGVSLVRYLFNTVDNPAYLPGLAPQIPSLRLVV